ncbi:uncharacterized protein si:ch211-199g17.2 [Cololabis saira]|uniref:uncharacterized protein si:ch211-199g17.2 n=1 Tax=Cololabis saira TaxID=129043 RepID=UPI002AD3754F|nr:uncharacterized protein si:ch211-199g17.2 [Cololabis saira]
MQPEVSSKSQLSNSLKVYLTNKDRLQPIIGLGSIIECVNVGTQNRQLLYLCEVCMCQLSHADIRNHILGSLHRFSYIKAHHPHLVSEDQNFNMPEQAWSLMMLAKTLEEKEGPGDVRLFEVEDAVYQKMKRQSEGQAITWINSLGIGHGDSGACPQSLSADFPTAPPRTALFADHQQSDSNGYLDSNCGEKPLIGLVHVVEFRCYDGVLNGFLCHCCRIKSNKKDIIDHLTSSSHIINYLMENYPDQVEGSNEEIKDNWQLLQSLADEAEQHEGRGEWKVVHLSEPQCMQLAGKSYHWCLKMLSRGWPNAKTEKQGETVKGPCVKKTSPQFKSEKCILMPKQRKNRRNVRKIKKRIDPVFMVNLTLNKGEMLLERTPFSADSLLESFAPVTSDSDPDLESGILDCESGCDTPPYAVDLAEGSQLQISRPWQDLYPGEVWTSEFISEGQAPSTDFQGVDDYVNDGEGFYQSHDATQTENHTAHEGWGYNGCHRSQGSVNNRFPRKWENEDLLSNTHGGFPAAPNGEDWTFDNSYYMQQEGGTEQLSDSASMIRDGTGMEGLQQRRDTDMGFSAVQHHHPQQHQHQQMAWNDGGLQTASMWGNDCMSHEGASYLSVPRINMQTPPRDALVHSGSFSQGLRKQVPVTDSRQWQTCSKFNINHSQTSPAGFTTHSTSYPVSQVNHRLMAYASYNAEPGMNPEQPFAYPISSNGCWSTTQTNAFAQPGQAVYYGV